MHFLLATIYYLFTLIAMCTFGLGYMLWCGLHGRWQDSTYICKVHFSFLFKLLGITLKVEGLENVPKENGFVMISNHQSFIDTNIFWHSIRPTAFIAKASLWKPPLFGWILTHIGCIPVNKNPRQNAGMGNLVADRLSKGYNIVVFPEGHRSGDGHMFKFQNGIFRMAKEHHFSILPITLVNAGNCLPKSKWALYPQEIKVVIHPLVKAEDYADKPMADLRDEMHDLIESAMPYKQADVKEA